ncbi:MAG: hypothetical protein R3C97_00360 [Geminicoccaceae bacterium]
MAAGDLPATGRRCGRMAALIRYFLTRAIADRLITAWPFMLTGIGALALGVGQAMMAEQGEASITFLAAGSRLALVLLIVAYTSIWIARDFESKEIELLTSRAASRLDLLLAMLVTILLLAAAMAAPLPLMALLFGLFAARGHRPLDGLVLWTVTLAIEAALAGTLALFVSLALPNPVIAMSVTFGWYLLARLSGTLLGTAGIAGEGQEALIAPAGSGDAGMVLDAGMHLLALVLPRLDLMAQSDWLVHGPATGTALFPTMLQCLVHGALLATAAFIDFRRRAF